MYLEPMIKTKSRGHEQEMLVFVENFNLIRHNVQGGESLVTNLFICMI